MSTLKVEVVTIDGITKHPNADRLDLAKVKGWSCVVQKGTYKVGDKALYIPIDSVLPEKLEAKIFGPNPKVKLHKHRVKTIKLRGAISQGLVINLDTAGLEKRPVGYDATKDLGIEKYEPPAPGFQIVQGKRSKKQPNVNFRKYTSIENIKNYNRAFEPEEEVVITEKIHGTNFRAGWVEFDPNTLWKKLKKFLGLAPEHEFVFGSHNVQLQNQVWKNNFFDNSVYAQAVERHSLKEKLAPGEVVYGEVYGPSIQSGYGYGLSNNETKLVVFDMMRDGKYLDHENVNLACFVMVLRMPPVLYQGKFKDADLAKLVDGPSVLCPDQEIREGCVVKPVKEQSSYFGRKILKAINPEYLLKDPTEYH